MIIIAIIITTGLIFIPSYSQPQQQEGSADLPPGVVVNDTFGPVFVGDYIIQLQDNMSAEAVDQKVLQVQPELAKQGGYVSNIYHYALKGFAIKNVSNLSMFINDPDIKSIDPDTFDTTSTQYPASGMKRVGLSQMSNAYKLDNRETKPNIDVAVIDQRIWIQHPDLNLFRNVEIVPVAESTPETSIHGIHVAGICCARDNLAGTVGSLPGARVWSISVFRAATGGAAGSDLFSAFDYIRLNAASIEIATMSIGCDLDVPDATCLITASQQTAITNMVNAGVTFFVAAGNAAENADGTRFCGATSAICVSAMTDTDGLCGGLGPAFTSTNLDDREASFTNFGSEVDIMAPGVGIWSLSSSPLHRTESQVIANNIPAPYIGASIQGGYASLSGTSMAAPLAAGVGALVKLLNPSFTPAQVKSNLLTNAYLQTQSCSGSKGGLVSGANTGSAEKMVWAGNY